MNRIRIGGDERNLDEATEHWLTEQIHNRKADGQAVCVQVIIDEGQLNMVLSTRDCPISGGGRAPKPQKRDILELWTKRGLSEVGWAVGNLIAFLKQLQQIL